MAKTVAAIVAAGGQAVALQAANAQLVNRISSLENQPRSTTVDEGQARMLDARINLLSGRMDDYRSLLKKPRPF